MAEKQSRTDALLSAVKKKSVSYQEQEKHKEMVELVIFTMAGRFYAFYGTHVKEILACLPITQVPGCPDLLRGIINVRGVIESVVNLHRILEVDEVKDGSKGIDRKTRIAIVSSKHIRSGILVDSVEDVITVEKSLIKPVLPSLSPAIRNFAEGGEIFYRDEYVVVLSVERLFHKIIPRKNQ